MAAVAVGEGEDSTVARALEVVTIRITTITIHLAWARRIHTGIKAVLTVRRLTRRFPPEEVVDAEEGTLAHLHGETRMAIKEEVLVEGMVNKQGINSQLTVSSQRTVNSHLTTRPQRTVGIIKQDLADPALTFTILMHR